MIAHKPIRKTSQLVTEISLLVGYEINVTQDTDQKQEAGRKKEGRKNNSFLKIPCAFGEDRQPVKELWRGGLFFLPPFFLPAMFQDETFFLSLETNEEGRMLF